MRMRLLIHGSLRSTLAQTKGTPKPEGPRLGTLNQTPVRKNRRPRSATTEDDLSIPCRERGLLAKTGLSSHFTAKPVSQSTAVLLEGISAASDHCGGSLPDI